MIARTAMKLASNVTVISAIVRLLWNMAEHAIFAKVDRTNKMEPSVKVEEINMARRKRVTTNDCYQAVLEIASDLNAIPVAEHSLNNKVQAARFLLEAAIHLSSVSALELVGGDQDADIVQSPENETVCAESPVESILVDSEGSGEGSDSRLNGANEA